MKADLFSKSYAQVVESEQNRFASEPGFISGLVRPIIFESWLRCRSRGQVRERVEDVCASGNELGRIMEASRSLLAISSQTVENIFAQPIMENSCLSLVNKDGVLLSAWYAQPDFAMRDKPGLIFREQYRGTGALTLAIETGKPQECFASEHYHLGYHDFYSCAWPVYDMSGCIIAFISMGTRGAAFHDHIRTMCRIIAQSIASQIHLQLVLEENAALFGVLEDALLVLDARLNILQANDKAMQMLNLRSSPRGKNLLCVLKPHTLFGQIEAGQGFVNQEATLHVQNGKTLNCIVTFSRFERERGGVLFFKDIKPMRDYAVMATGSYATYCFDDIVAISKPMKQLLAQARKAAPSNISVLICGESGVGKELLAHSLHNASQRKNRPFVAVNCGALPKELIQAELFGYSPGAFTGARGSGNPGKFELADGGTIFLDEIGEMPLDTQANLLRVLQNGEFMRLGGKNVRHADVRIMAATNRNLEQLVEEKIFRLDLFYRLNVITLKIPPLRERQDDIGPLVEKCLQRISRRQGVAYSIHPKALDMLINYTWPGNVRELENAVEYAAHMSQNTILESSDLPHSVARAVNHATSAGGMHERSRLDEILRKYRGNITAAAQALGTTRALFYRRLKKYGLQAQDYRGPGWHQPLSADVQPPEKMGMPEAECPDALKLVLEKLTPGKLEKLARLLEIL